MNTSGKRSLSRSLELPSIPEDLVIDILLNVPVKSLLRFKSVCKSWYNWIKSPKFISMHHNLGNTISHLLICTSGGNRVPHGHRIKHVLSFRSNDKFARESFPDLEIPPTRDRAVFVAGSCNGIVCFSEFSKQAIYLSNPATRELKLLPPTCIVNKSDTFVGQVGFAFGFHPPNIYDFKVLRVYDVYTIEALPNSIRAEMFTLSSNSWREIEWSLHKRFHFLDYNGLFCADSFHFIAGGSFHSRDQDTIVCCHIQTERFTTIDFPSKYDHQREKFVSLMAINECLSTVFKHEEKWMELWIMKEHGVVESWSKFYRIEPPWGFARVLCFWMDDHALLLFQDEQKELRTYNLNNSLDAEIIETYGYDRDYKFVVFKETLVSIM